MIQLWYTLFIENFIKKYNLFRDIYIYIHTHTQKLNQSPLTFLFLAIIQKIQQKREK